MALPEDSQGLSMADAVEASLADLNDQLRPADLALVTRVRMAARAIDDLLAADKVTQALNYMYLVDGGLERLGGSVESRKKLGTKDPKPESKLALVRNIHGGEGSAEEAADGGEPGRKPKRKKRAAG